MVFQEYTFEPLGTIVEDHGEGRVKIVYGRSADTLEQVAEQAKWIGEIFETLNAKYPRKELVVLADLGKLERVSLDDKTRAIYQEILQREYIHKTAIVGDAFSYTRVLTLMVILAAKRDHVRFFFHHTEAKDWLGW